MSVYLTFWYQGLWLSLESCDFDSPNLCKDDHMSVITGDSALSNAVIITAEAALISNRL